MTFTLEIMARELAACIAACNLVTESGVKIPVLKATYIKVADGKATFIATNTDQTVSVSAAAAGDGIAVIDTAMLDAKVRVCRQDAPIVFSGDDKNVSASQGRAKWSMPCLDVSTFPIDVTKPVEADHFDVEPKGLLAAMAETHPGMEHNSPTTFGGMFFHFFNGGIRLVGMYKAGMHVRQVRGDFPEYRNFILPSEACRHVMSLFKDTVSAQIRATENSFTMQSDRAWYRSKLVEGEFMPYRKIIEMDRPNSATVDPVELLASIKRACAIRDDGKGHRLKCVVSDGSIHISMRNMDGEESADECRVEIDGDDGDFSLFPPRLISALETLECDTIRISYLDRTRAVVFSPINSDVENFRVLQPMIDHGR